jgi:hypothetical protein
MSRFHLVPDKLVLRRLKANFCQVFRENSAPLRRNFFNEPLIQALWPQFIETERDSINSYLQDLHLKQRQTLIMDAIEISFDNSLNIFGGL